MQRKVLPQMFLKASSFSSTKGNFENYNDVDILVRFEKKHLVESIQQSKFLFFIVCAMTHFMYSLAGWGFVFDRMLPVVYKKQFLY